MLVFIDESGDPGFKIARGSSSHFVVAMVFFDEDGVAERTSLAVAEARERLRVKPEFRFSKACDAVRDEFFAAVGGFDFRVRALVVDKAAIYSERLRDTPAVFYRYFVRMLLDHDGGALSDARVRIDGSGDREFKRELGAYLRRELKAGKVRDVRFGDSCRDNLLQVADMAAGAVLRSYRGGDRDRCERWLRMLRRSGRIENIWPFR